ncbi:DUF2894 domain-containing protein [Paraburkholderia acidisoli]|uniref:DUF2894 domain-containing protein n=1 Tax=Paraburkholderia acidisoli TaxID=2571748 RepID=A0A7Z2GKE1_9BURK|nr:DUF2894 domain-containing protein [Paraburkholderia acidisoli]QGZ63438.1 DUF2894 domain-containing protein [Paraburkholderia acidisoli]
MDNGARPDAAHARTLLDTWRARGADRFDPVRFHFIEALARRAATQHGEARRLLDARLAQLLRAFASDVARANEAGTARAAAFDSHDDGRGDSRRRSALGVLVDAVARPEPEQPASRVRHEPDPELVDYFRKTWSRVRTETQLRQSLDQVPKNAGPLNSSSLVHRALSLMREVSPGYLQHFLAYADALSWLEQVGGSVPSAPTKAPAKEPVRAARKTRKAR